MSVYEHLLKIVEDTSFSSANNKIAEFLLLHYENIPQLTVKEIANGAYVSKGTVSKFFLIMSSTGNFDCFQKAWETESSNHKIYLKRSEEIFLNRKKKYNKEIINTDHLKLLKERILSSKKIILFTKLEFEGVSKDFCRRLLLGFGIVAKTAIYAYDESMIDEVSSLSEDDLLLFVDADCSFYEHTMHMTYEFDIARLISNTKASSVVVTQRTSNVGSELLFEEIIISEPSDNYSEMDIYKNLYTEILVSLNE